MRGTWGRGTHLPGLCDKALALSPSPGVQGCVWDPIPVPKGAQDPIPLPRDLCGTPSPGWCVGPCPQGCAEPYP